MTLYVGSQKVHKLKTADEIGRLYATTLDPFLSTTQLHVWSFIDNSIRPYLTLSMTLHVGSQNMHKLKTAHQPEIFNVTYDLRSLSD